MSLGLKLKFETNRFDEVSWVTNAYLVDKWGVELLLVGVEATEPALSIQKAEDAAYELLERFVKGSAV